MKEEVHAEKNYGEAEEGINLKDLLFKFLNYWPWFVGS